MQCFVGCLMAPLFRLGRADRWRDDDAGFARCNPSARPRLWRIGSRYESAETARASGQQPRSEGRCTSIPDRETIARCAMMGTN